MSNSRSHHPPAYSDTPTHNAYLERTRGHLGAGRADTDDAALAPALVQALERRTAHGTKLKPIKQSKMQYVCADNFTWKPEQK